MIEPADYQEGNISLPGKPKEHTPVENALLLAGWWVNDIGLWRPHPGKGYKNPKEPRLWPLAAREIGLTEDQILQDFAIRKGRAK